METKTAGRVWFDGDLSLDQWVNKLRFGTPVRFSNREQGRNFLNYLREVEKELSECVDVRIKEGKVWFTLIQD